MLIHQHKKSRLTILTEKTAGYYDSQEIARGAIIQPALSNLHSKAADRQIIDFTPHHAALI